MLKKIFLLLICTICLLAAIGCGNGEPAAGGEEVITVEVVNNTEGIIISWAAFFGPGLDEWGTDLLGDRVIEPGQKIAFQLPKADQAYSLLLFTYELFVVKSVANITGDTIVEVGGGDKIPVLIENNSDKAIAVFFISPSVSSDWGENLIGDVDVIPAEFGRRFLFIDPVPAGPPAEQGTGNKDESLPDAQGVKEDENGQRVIPEGTYYDIYYIYSDGEEVVQFDVLIEGEEPKITIN